MSAIPANTIAVSAASEAKHAPRMRADSLADGVVIVLVMMVMQRLFGFGRGVLFCRWLEPEAFGEWGLVFNFLLLAAPLAVLGLPGSFGRYLEYYRQRGALRTFLRRTTAWTIALATFTVAGICFALPMFSDLIFGRADLTTLVALSVICLAAVIWHHFLESLYLALRMNRVVSGMQFCQSVGFAVLGALLLWFWEMSAASIVIAYAAASVISAAGSLFWLRGIFDDQPVEESPTPQREFWSRLLPFAVWVWVANVLANLFAVIDRYMLVHFSGLDSTEALAQVGYYQSSLIVPLLLVSVSDLIGAMLMPHMSHDWEAGRRDHVDRTLNLAIKLVSLALLAGAVAVLAVAPLLFGIGFAGKYAGGYAVLPWTLTQCILFGISMVANNYLWCAERARLCSLTLVIGLGVNVALNLVLLPRYGLLGAVLGTVTANAAVLLLTLWFNRLAGMRVERAAVLLALAPVAIGFGFPAAIIMLLFVGAMSVTSERIFTAHEKHLLAGVAHGYLNKIRRRKLRSA